MVFEVQKGRVCELVMKAQEREINLMDALIANQGKQIIILTEQKDIAINGLNTWAIRYDFLKDDSKAKLKQSRLQTVKFALIAIGEAVIIVLLII